MTWRTAGRRRRDTAVLAAVLDGSSVVTWRVVKQETGLRGWQVDASLRRLLKSGEITVTDIPLSGGRGMTRAYWPPERRGML